MEYQEWRNQHQSDEHQSAKLPKMVQYSTVSASPGMGSLFSMAQWQELELQAQIYPYVMAEASVPLDLILSLKRSIVSSSPCNFYHLLQPSMVQTGYWGRCLVDPELGRCRRTDGKKWRCSREVVPGHKYCDRHVHRGRNRSRKHVEIHPTTTGSKKGHPSPMKEKKETRFTQPPPLSIIPLNHRPSDDRTIDGCLLGKGSSSQVLMKFFDDWPNTKQESTSSSNNATILPLSTPDNSSSDVSLKLSTGKGDWLRFENPGEASSMGGPLAEALRSSISPTSVLENLNGSVCSDTGLC